MSGQRFVTTTVEIEGREEIAVVEVPAFEAPRWGKDAALDTVGQRVPRLDAVAKVTGRARYTHDIRLPDMLHARLVRAAIPAGRVVRLDRCPNRVRRRSSGKPLGGEGAGRAADHPELPLTPTRVLEAIKKHSLDTE